MGNESGYGLVQNPSSAYGGANTGNLGYAGSTSQSPSTAVFGSTEAMPVSTEFGQFFKQFLDRQYPNASPLVDTPYTRNRDYYTLIAYGKAFGKKDDAWQPDRGFKVNEAIIRRLYDYYQNTFLSFPRKFLWAGLGRLAGSAVLGGLLTPGLPDPSFLTDSMVLIGKTIFLDLAWQHELFAVDPAKAIAMAKEHDTHFPASAKYEEAWTKINTNTAADIAAGNVLLLQNEQLSIIQPLYDQINQAQETDSRLLFAKTSAFTNNIHPYHLGFFESFPTTPKVDITVAADRWKWITMANGMWEKWISIPAAERTRLTSLPMADLLARRWGRVIEDQLPPGAH